MPPPSEVAMEFTRVRVPQFSSSDFTTYKDEVEIWSEVCNVSKAKQGMLLWLELLRNDPSNIKELIMNKVGKDVLKTENGVNKFLEARLKLLAKLKKSATLMFINNLIKT